MKSNKRIAGVIVLILTFLTFSGFIAMMIAPKEKTAEVNGLKITSIPDYDGRAGEPHFVLANISSKNSDSLVVLLHYYRDNTFKTLKMSRLPGTNYFGVQVPADELGKRTYYYIEAMDDDGNVVRLPASADQTFDSEYDYFKIRYEGKATFILLLLHIVLMIGAFFLLIHALYYALNYLFTRERGDAIIRTVNLGIITFFITGFPIGWIIEKQVLGNYWEGIPFGWDITDSKTLIILIIWLILIIFRAKDKVSLNSYAKWVIVNTIITIALFLLPHSL